MKHWGYFFLITLVGCISEYDPQIEEKSAKLVIDGMVTNQPGPYEVRLSYSAAYNNDESIFGRYPRGARVILEDDAGHREELTEIGSALFRTDSFGIQGVVGRSYTLSVRLEDGTHYQSRPELLKPVPEIDRVVTEYEPLQGGYLRGQLHVYLDTDDPADSDDFYRWNWTHYGTIEHCLIITKKNQDTGITEQFLSDCCAPCWEIDRCNGCINLGTDEFVNGQQIARQPIATIPYDSDKRYFMLIEQSSLTKSAYRFWQTVDEQINNTGGIFDKPPVTIQGNLFNPDDPEEQVLGYFGASSIAYRAVFINRAAIREPFFSPPLFPQYDFPDCTECRNGPIRTPFQPKGWDEALLISPQ